ncbi:arylacetamide deacetylase isoform X2 [Latimeria chalumnae]|nr:PREDICTED: arylacetamide deacetylase isoform X2 [Latimeria chalumnae]|eukprot:XP_014344114.1 PREDICTED: arylacetamide deacetylase isoform X2 [Latimeria chalumnae]
MEVMMLLTDAEQVGPSSNENVTVTDTTFNDVPVRLYIPRKETKELRRAIIYIHGGGWCLGSAKMEPYDIMSRRTASEVNAVVVSVEYRLAPEYHFPVQFDDVYAVVKYFLQDEVLAMYSVDAARIGVSGDSAGGNLAAAVAQQIRQEPEVKGGLKIQALLYPALQTLDLNTPSYQQNKYMPILPKTLMIRFLSEYFTTDRSLYQAMFDNKHTSLESNQYFKYVNWSIFLPEKFRQNYKYTGPIHGHTELLKKYPGILDPRAAPLLVDDNKLQMLPKAYIMTSEYDVLRDDGVMYATRLRKAGVQVTLDHFEDGYHGALLFLVWPTDFAIAHRMLDKYIDWLKSNL